MILTKNKGVRFNILTPAMAHMLYRLEMFHSERLVPQPVDLTITSINDGQHMEGSRHYTDEAIDIRTKNFKNEEDKIIFALAFQDFLGKKFRVLFENRGTPNEHFHVQVKKGQKYP